MKIFLLLGSINAFLAVALGAFGAHGLKARVAPEMLTVWQTGVLYHLFHALGLLAVGILALQLPHSSLLRPAGWALLVGVVLFSGSLYLMVLSGVRALGMITPLGGVAFLAGWILVAFGVWKS